MDMEQLKLQRRKQGVNIYDDIVSPDKRYSVAESKQMQKAIEEIIKMDIHL